MERNINMKHQEFYALVESMRNAQKKYFETRNREWLKTSMQLERKVDEEIKSAKETANQTTLFE